MSSQQTFFSSSPGPAGSSSGRLRPRRSTEGSSSRTSHGLGRGTSRNSVVNYAPQIYDHDGQDIFKDLVFPPMDDGDDLSYEDSDGGGRKTIGGKASDAGEKADDGIGASVERKLVIRKKGKERETEPEKRQRSASATPVAKEELRSDYGPVISQDDDLQMQYYDDDDDDEPLGEDDEERPNKFQGASKTWHTWTKKERVEFNAMEKIRSRDLSAHLFNAFALKKRARDLGLTGRNMRTSSTPAPSTSRPTTPATGTGSLDWELNDYPGEEGTNPLFTPPKGWATWPMPANVVPRTDENRFREPDDLWTIRMEPDARPSAELEECIMAEVLRAGKERFNAREWKEDLEEGGRSRLGSRYGSRVPTVASGKEDDVPGKENSEFESEIGDLEKRGLQVPILRPVVTADDEKAKTVLRPAARHVLTGFDDLLMGLHHARQAYVTMGGVPKMDPDTEAEDSPDEYARRKKRKRPTTRAPDHDMEKLEDAENQPSPVPAPPSPRKRRKTGRSKSRSRLPQKQTVSQVSRQQLLGRRDWGDVMGLASMTGWPAAAVMRASRRCAELFGEDMLFRTMDEGELRLEHDENERPVWKYTEDESEGTSPEHLEKTNTATVPEFIGRKEYAKYCPVKECPRHTKGFSRTWNLNQHLKRKHPDAPLAGTIKSDVEDHS